MGNSVMPISRVGILLFIFGAVAALRADVVVLHDGSSYTGQLSQEKITFKGNDGVDFTFPSRDLQSMVFTAAADTVTLASGKVYSGHYTGASDFNLAGADGVSYRFPMKDVASIVFTGSDHREERAPEPAAEHHTAAKVIPQGTDIDITTNERIDSKSAREGELFKATVASDLLDSRGQVAIRRGTPAKLIIRDLKTQGAVSTPELVLDLYSIDEDGRDYRTITTNVQEHGRESVGANRRTLTFAGGGGGLGALLGGVFGGGRGAGIGALAGAGGGALTELFTRGHKVEVPAETTLTFRLERTLVLRHTGK